MRLPLFWCGVVTAACGGNPQSDHAATGSAGVNGLAGAGGAGSSGVPVVGAGGTSAPGGGGTLGASGSSGTVGGSGAGGASGVGGGASGVGGGASGVGGGAPARPPDLSHTFDTIPINAGDEIVDLCQSWTLNNDAPFYVNTVTQTNLGYFHHSNWIWVPDTLYTGPDGTWKCADRNFDQVAAGAFGGVFFAQSTQSRSDTQAFPADAAFEVPAHARIIGNAHLLNTTQDSATSSLTLDVYTLTPDAAKIRLQPMAFTNLTLDIAPQTTTSAHMQCATPETDFNVFYILPHFHALGTGMTIDVAGGPSDGTNVFTSSGNLGESLGHTFDPPLPVKGAAGLGITCTYDNPRTTSVHYGNGDEEMCVALIYSDGKKAGGETLSNVSVTDVGGVHETDGLCVSVGSP